MSPRHVFVALCSLGSLALSRSAVAQSFNIDIGGPSGNAVPGASFGAAAAQPGPWNAVQGEVPTVTTQLTDVSGALANCWIHHTGGATLSDVTNLVGATPDDMALMSDVQDPGTAGVTWRISGLAPGTYDVFTYAMAPDEASFRTRVFVTGSTDPPADIGGAWPGAYVGGTTHARHRIHMTPTTPWLLIAAERTPSPPAPAFNFASVNGIQIVRLGAPGSSFCAGDGTLVDHTTPCPCGNSGGTGRGCANSVIAVGAGLSAGGFAAADTVILYVQGMPTAVACIFLQGDALDDAVFGDGVRCAGGTLLRLRTKTSVAGASWFPDSLDTVTLSQRGGVTIGSGVERFYQTYYRNAAAAWCPPETFNVTNGWRITW